MARTQKKPGLDLFVIYEKGYGYYVFLKNPKIEKEEKYCAACDKLIPDNGHNHFSWYDDSDYEIICEKQGKNLFGPMKPFDSTGYVYKVRLDAIVVLLPPEKNLKKKSRRR